MNCPNCANPIGCSCSGGSSLAKASNGTQVCSKCIQRYEEYLGLINLNKSNNPSYTFKDHIKETKYSEG